MKKFFSLLSLLMIVLSVNAQTKFEVAQNQTKVVTNAASSFDDAPVVIKYTSGDAIGGMGGVQVQSGISVAICVPAASYRGTSIKYIRIGLYGAMTNVTCNLRTSLDGEPVFSKSLGDVTEAQWLTAQLDTPYVVTDDQEWIVIGYTGILDVGAYSIGIQTTDRVTPNSCFVSLNGGDWEDLSSRGWLACIEAHASGEPVLNSLSIAGPNYVSCYNGTAPTCTVSFQNIGVEAVQNFDVEYEFMGKKYSSQYLQNIPTWGTGAWDINLPAAETNGEYPLSVKITKVNGEANGSPESSFNTTVYVVDESYKKMIVCEELTGTTCPYCPRGIVVLEQMREKYPDTFLPIAAHIYSTSDPMYTSTYTGLGRYINAAPGFLLDRKVACDPSYGEAYYSELIKAAPIANINLSVSVDPTNNAIAKLNATTKFAFSKEKSNYRIAFVVLEDNVDKSKQGTNLYQSNAFSNSTTEVGGWEKLGSYVKTTYMDVARGIYNFSGLDNSVPAAITAEEEYSYSYELAMPYVLNIENVRFAALLIDSDTGVIENACVIPFTSAGINGTSTDESMVSCKAANGGIAIQSACDEPMRVAVYSVAGSLVATQDNVTNSTFIPVPSNGVYIVRCTSGTKTSDIKIAL